MSNKFPYFKHLQAKLDNRRCRIMNSTWEMFPYELKSFLDFLNSVPITKTILDELDTVIKQTDFSEYNFGGRGIGGSSPKLPEDEKKRVAFYYKTLKEIKKESDLVQITYANVFSQGSNSISDSVQGFKEQVFIPFYDYIFERVSDGDFLLYLLVRFKIKSEFFDKKNLFNIYKHSGREEDLDKELRRFLFIEGIDYPYSKPKAPSGEADIVLEIEENPVPLEVKIFDPEKSYNKKRIIDGANQVKRYADDYNYPMGYLVIFNPSNKYLEVSSSYHPPILSIGSKEVAFIIIDINPSRPTASKEKILTREYLTQDDFIEK